MNTKKPYTFNMKTNEVTLEEVVPEEFK